MKTYKQVTMSDEDKDEKVPLGELKTSISDEEKERIMREHGTKKLSEEEWIELLNKYD